MYGNFWEICIYKHIIHISRRNHTSNDRNWSRFSRFAPKRSDYKDETQYKRAEIRWRLLGRDIILLKGGAWNMPKESCVKETVLEIGENDKYPNAGFRLTVNLYLG